LLPKVVADMFEYVLLRYKAAGDQLLDARRHAAIEDMRFWDGYAMCLYDLNKE